MSKTRLLLAGLSAALLNTAGAAPDLSGKAAVIEVGRFAFVTDAQSEYLSSSVDAAVEGGAAAIALKIDCPGGFAASGRRFVEHLSGVEMPVISWVEGKAAGAGAFAALAADKVYLKPGERWIGGEVEAIDWRGPVDALPRRLTDLRYYQVEKELAEVLLANKVQPEVVAGLANPGNEVVLGGKKYSDAGDVLRIDAEDGAELGLIDATAATLDEALGGLEAVVLPAPEVVLLREIEPAGGGEPEPEPEAEPTPETAEIDEAVEIDETAEPAVEDRRFGETRMESYADKIVVLEVSEETLMRRTKFEFLQRIVEKADADGARAIIFDMDSPGGALWETMSQMLKHLQNLEVPTYTYVNTRAISAGSMIAISTDHIYMHPPSTIGASAPVAGGGADIEGRMYEKIISTFEAVAKDVAPLKGRDPELVLAFIEVERSYSARVPVVSAAGDLSDRVLVEVGPDDLLSLGSREAAEIVDGRPLLADGVAKTLDEMIEQAGLEGEVVTAKPLGFESVADWLVKIGPWLLIFGLAGAYMEMKAPGFGLPGFISLICFGLFFFGHQAAGFLAGYEAIGIFLLGIVLIVIELFVFPGLLVFGAAGLLMVFGSIVYAMVDPVDLGWAGKLDFSNIGAALVGPALNLVLGLLGAALLIVLAIRYLPSTPLMRWLVLDTGLEKGTGMQLAGGAGAIEGDDSGGGDDSIVGQSGEAETDLRPAGSARVGGQRIDVVSAGEFIPRGVAVRVIEVEGSRVVVEELPGSA